MIDVTVTCRICGIEHEPDRAACTRGEWRSCQSCRAAIREHAERAMRRLGYAPPHPASPHHAAPQRTFDDRWRQQLANAERFLSRVHALETEGEDE